jgi:hypothetical protein
MTEDPDGDLALLRAFEPVIRFTRGEYFFPVSTERYLRRAALWSETPAGDPVLKAVPGELDLATLDACASDTEGLGESLSGIVTSRRAGRVRIPVKDRPPRLKGGSRLAAVGLLARLVDALNRLSLVFRGSVPGGSAARSFLLQRDHLAPDEPTYYGRVLRDEPWIVLQYWYFYAFNNWRSGFGGVNEHEADWEQVTVFLDGSGATGAEDLPAPRWVVFSAHDETGDDLRRRWDDPDLTLVDARHPVVFAGAGSHAGVYLAGDYLITIPAPTLGGLVKAVRWLAALIAPWTRRDEAGSLGIPYVDYARGDGRVIGAGGDAWHPVLISEDTGWVRAFRGLWGHDTRDRLGGERGPAGPRHERDGTVRPSWADPVGWSGLAKVAPNPELECELLEERARRLADRLSHLEKEIADGRRDLRTTAAGLSPASPEVRDLVLAEAGLLGRRMELVRLSDEHARVTDALARPPAPTAPHAHLTHRRLPLTPVAGFRNRLLAGWAVVSTPVILFAAAAVVSPAAGISGATTAAAWLVLLLCIEGFLRAHLLDVLLRIASTAALLVGMYYAVTDWRIVLGWGLLGAAALLLVVNLRDAVKR